MKRAFKRGLIVSTAILLWACTAADAPPAPNKQTSNEIMTDKLFSYDDAGKTDADHLYLEEVLGEAALDEVKAWNERSLSRLEADPRFAAMQSEALAILNSKDKIPYVSYRIGQVHNFWQDADHVRGIWRRAGLESYLTDTPEWETVLDIDALSKREDKNWVYKGNNAYRTAAKTRLCAVNLTQLLKASLKTGLT